MLNIVAGSITLAAYIPYIATVLTGKTRPSMVSWWIWAGVGLLLRSTYASLGGQALGLATGAMIGQFLIAILAIRYGERVWTLLDKLCLAGAIVAATLWWLTSSAFLPYLLVVFIDACALLPTFQKAIVHPRSENIPAWALWALAAYLSLLAIDRWTIDNTLYPLYLVVTNTLVLLAILRRYVR